MKLYIVMYGNEIKSYENLCKGSAIYIGTCREAAEREYKATMRYSEGYNLMEIEYDENKFQKHTPNESLKKDELAYGVGRKIEDILSHSSISVMRRMIKNGKVSISVCDYEKYKTADKVENEFSKTIDDVHRALKFKIDKFVSDNNITVPIRIKNDCKEFLVYNQK